MSSLNKSFSLHKGLQYFLIITICSISVQHATAHCISLPQDTAKIHKNANVKSSGTYHKGGTATASKSNKNSRSIKHTKGNKNTAIKHSAPNQSKLDSIVKAKNKEKSGGK